MRCLPELPPEIVDEVAAVLARGYLKYRQSLAIPTVSQLPETDQKCLDVPANPSLHVPAVNEPGEGEN